MDGERDGEEDGWRWDEKEPSRISQPRPPPPPPPPKPDQISAAGGAGKKGEGGRAAKRNTSWHT